MPLIQPTQQPPAMKLIQKSASAVAFAHKLNSMPKIVGFGDIRDDVFNELTQHEKICGVKVSALA